MWRSCPYCHQNVFFLFSARHEAQHMRLRSDGQQEEHVTLPPGQRVQQSLDGVPCVYRHEKCGACTGMPEEIIRSYLANPFLYDGTTFCAGCRRYCPEGEFAWTETGERLSKYFNKLKAEVYLRQSPPRR